MIPLIDFILKMLKMVLGILALPITFLISIIKRLLKFVYVFCENVVLELGAYILKLDGKGDNIQENKEKID